MSLLTSYGLSLAERCITVRNVVRKDESKEAVPKVGANND